MDLQAYLSETKTTPARFAQIVNVSGAAMSRYLKRQRMPRPDVMERIAIATGGRVQPNDFFIFHTACGGR